VALIKAEQSEGESQVEEITEKDREDLKIRKDTLAETVRKNKKAEELKLKEIEIKKKVANKPIMKAK
jgi:hypothetical protein